MRPLGDDHRCKAYRVPSAPETSRCHRHAGHKGACWTVNPALPNVIIAWGWGR